MNHASWASDMAGLLRELADDTDGERTMDLISRGGAMARAYRDARDVEAGQSLSPEDVHLADLSEPPKLPLRPVHSHYFKDVSKLQVVDVYRVLELFAVTDPCIGHAVKKLLVAGGRGHKDAQRDVQDAIDSLQRRIEMWDEDAQAV